MGRDSDFAGTEFIFAEYILKLLSKMGNGGNKEAITENKVTAAVEIEKLRDIPAFHLIIPPKREWFCFSVLWLENDIHSALSALKEIILNNVCLVFRYFRETRALNAAGEYSFFPSSICVRLCLSFYTNIPGVKEKKISKLKNLIGFMGQLVNW